METPEIIFFVSNEKKDKFYEDLWDTYPDDYFLTKEQFMSIVRVISGGYSRSINTIGICLPTILLVVMINNFITLRREDSIIKHIDHVLTHEFLHYLIREFTDDGWSMGEEHEAIRSMGYYGKRN